MESIRVELPTGAWWDIKAELTRADRRFIDREVETMAFDTMSRLEQSGMSMEKLQDITSAASAPTDNQKKWGAEEEEAYILRCSVGWSWDEEITAESIGERPDRFVKRVLSKMRELYVEEDDREGKSLSGESLSSLNLERLPLDGTGTLSKPSA